MIIKEKIDLKKYGERFGRYVKFTYNTKTKKVRVKSKEIKDVRDVGLIKNKIGEKLNELGNKTDKM